MGRKHGQILLFLTFICIYVERSVPCRWDESFLSEGQCFLFNSTELSYSNAKGECHAKGGVLAKMTTMSQIGATASAIPKENTNIWIGASDVAVEGTWVWEDGGDIATELSDIWSFGEPNNQMGTEDCAQIEVIYGDAGLIHRTVAKDCTGPYTFLCMEKELTTTLELTTSTAASTSSAKCQQKNGVNFINFNDLLFLHLSAFNYLFI